MSDDIHIHRVGVPRVQPAARAEPRTLPTPRPRPRPRDTDQINIGKGEGAEETAVSPTYTRDDFSR